MKKNLSLFLILFCASLILFSSTTITEARPLPLIFEGNGSNDWLINLDFDMVKLLRPKPFHPPPPPQHNPPIVPALSSPPKAKHYPNMDVFAPQLSEDFLSNQHTASA